MAKRMIIQKNIKQHKMVGSKLFVGLLFFAFILSFNSKAQTQLEFAAGSGSTTNGLTIANQSATFLNNSSGTTFNNHSPAIIATISLTNQQYTSIPQSIISTSNAMNFGGTVNSYGVSSPSVPNFTLLNAINSPSSVSYTSNPNGPANTAIDVAVNQGFYMYNSVHPLFTANANLQGRFYYGDLTVTFNQPVTNPVLHLVGLGGNTIFGGGNTQGYSTELELQNTNVIASKLSGTSNFQVNSNNITNSSPTPNFTCGSGAACGSVKIAGTNITSLTFKVFVKGDGNGTAWSHVNINAGDEWMLSVSLNTPVTLSGNVFNDANGLADNLVNGIGTNANNSLFVNLVDTAGKVVQSISVNNNGAYSFNNVGEGNYTIILSTTQGTQGNTAPTASLPSGYVNTGENLGAGLGSDASINGVLPVTVTSTNVTNANFGIYNCPTITNASANQTLCMGSTGSNITVSTNSNDVNSIKFVKFASNQIAGATPTITELNNIYAGTVIATATPTGSSPNFTATYTWNSNDFVNNTNAPITYYIYAIASNDSVGTCKPYQEVRVTVNPMPVIAAITGTNTICVGNTASLSNATNGGVWSTSNNSIATINGSGLVTGVSAGNATITYTVTNSFGCTTISTYLVTVVSAASNPIITASGATTACLGTGLTLSSSTSATYQWYKDGVAIVGANSQTFVPTVSGTYTMVIVAGGGACNSISNAISVTINYAATPSIAPAGDTVVICTKVNEKLCPATWGYSNYQWYKDGVLIPSPLGTASCLYPTQPGRYTLTAQDGSGCWSQQSAAANVKIDTTCTGNVTGGNGGGVESKPLGDVIAQRLYGNAVNSIPSTFNYTSATPFVRNNGIIINGGAGNLQLSSLLPPSTSNTNKTFISSPVDLVNFTNAIDIFSVDYLQNTTTRAVALATKTLAEVYSHTKVICDRLKEAELLEVKKVNVRGFDLIFSKLKHYSGEVEYVINFSLSINKTRSTFGLQSNWMTDNYAKEDTMYNFQLWGASYNTTIGMANDVLAKMDSIKTIVPLANNISDLPITYVSKGIRNVANIELSIYNPTAANNMQLQFVEKKNEQATTIRKSQNYNITSFGTSKISIPVSDLYEHNIYVYVGGKLVDLVYVSDGSWTADYDKAVTTLNKFTVSNETNISFASNEYPLLRNVDIDATTKQNISAYKLIKASGLSKDLTAYKGIKFNASAKGTTTLKITILKRGITKWADQYSYKLSITDVSKEYAVGLDKFLSSASSSKLKVDDITAVIFTWENNRGVNSAIGGTLNKVRFTQEDVSYNQAIVSKEISVYPNPNNGKFNINFMAEEDGALVLKIIDIAKGSVVETKFINAKKGSNTINVVTSISAANLSTYYLLLEGDGVKYIPKKVMITK
jgi:hypothetical protein